MVHSLKRFSAWLLLVSLFTFPAFGALSASTVWETRTLGNNNNGGGYVTGSSGTDFSQQNAAQCTATDLVLVTATTATSAACPFSATSPGNLIQITAGTNFTTGFYQVVSQAAGTATLDRAAGTMGATGGTFALGGALASPQQSFANAVAGNFVYMKADGTYTVTTSSTLPNLGGNGGVTVIGYTTTRTDGGRVTWTSATNSVALIQLGTSRGFTLQNFNMSSTAGTRGVCVQNNGNIIVQGASFLNVLFDGCASGVSLRQIAGGFFSNVEIKNSTGFGLRLGINSNSSGTGATLYNVYIHNNAGGGVESSNTSGAVVTISHSTISANTGNGVQLIQASGQDQDNLLTVVDSVIAGNSTNGINSSSALKVILNIANTIIYGNTTNGVTCGVVPFSQLSQVVAYGANGTNRVNFAAGANDITLTADPFVNSAAGNYALNNTAGGGAALRGTGFPGVSLFGTGYTDVGPLQHQAGTAGASYGFAN